MNCCSKKKRFLKGNEAELKSLVNLTRFTLEELKVIRNRFFRISNTNHKMTKSQFRENMGLLGLESVFFISDRIFDMIDLDKDSLIDLQDFVKYLDIMVNGSQKEKYYLSFKLVDKENKGFFSFSDFSLMISSMVSVWSALTGAQITADTQKKLELYVKYIFDEMDREQNGKITLKSYVQALEKCPNLLEIYEFMNNSFTTSSIFEARANKYQEQENVEILEHMKILENHLNKMTLNIKDQQNSPKFLSQDQIIDKKKGNLGNFELENEIKKRNNDKTFRKIDESIKKILFHANIDADNIILNNDNENLKSRDISERNLFGKMPSNNDISEKNSNVFKLKPPFLKKYVMHETDNIPFSIESPKIFLSHNVDFNEEKEDEKFDSNLLKQLQSMQKQVNLIKEKLENQISNKNQDIEIEESPTRKKRSFTTLNVHKPLKNKNKNFGNKAKMVFLGHENWNFVLNMMLGIQMAAKSVIFSKDFSLAPKDFKLKYCFELIPRRIKNKKNSKEITKICKFFDYAPYVFHEIRNLFGIKTEDYLKSIGPDNLLSNLLKGNLTTLTELVSTGKSGSFFYYSNDGRFTLKTIHRAEFHFLKKILKNYYEYIINNPQTFIVKFFGLHKMRFKFNNALRWKKVYIIIMSNVFHTSKEINDRYDIKGSIYKRFTKETLSSVIKKDQNALKNNLKLKLTPEKMDFLLEQLKCDCHFFEQNQIIDYSLLIGIHYRNHEKKNEIKISSALSLSEINTGFNATEEIGILSSDGSEEYFFGVIDILTSFNTKKKLEFLFKTVAIDKSISAIPPIPYSIRFQNFIKTNLIQISY